MIQVNDRDGLSVRGTSSRSMFVDAITRTADRRTVRSLTKLFIAASALLFVTYLLTLLPGVDRLVPSTPVTFVALAGAVATVVLVALLACAAPRLATVTRVVVSGPRAVVEHVAAVVYWLVVLAAVLVAHRGFAGVILPLLDGAAWIYDLVFLLAALPSVVVIAARLYVGIDPAATTVADGLLEEETNDDGHSSQHADDEPREETTDRERTSERGGTTGGDEVRSEK